jgi:hypothetical protein
MAHTLRDPALMARLTCQIHSGDVTTFLAGLDDTDLRNAIEDAVVLAQSGGHAATWHAVAGAGLAILDARS